jgi:hypothetical protein
MNDLDIHIKSDLSALGEETRQKIGEFSETVALLDRRPAYRDDRPGAEARRDALADRRRLELALMPMAVGRMFAHRVSRAAAGAVATASAAVLFMGLWEPDLVRLAEFMIPTRLTITLISLGVIIAILTGYILAGWIAERVFERHMRESLLTTGDAYEDLDALAAGPLERARQINRRVDGWSVMLPLLGIATLAPVSAFVSLGTFESSLYGLGLADFASYANVGGDLVLLALGVLAGAVVAFTVGRACDRSHRTLARPVALRVFGHAGALIAGLAIGLVVLALLGSTFTGLRVGHLPPSETRLLLAVAGTLAVTGPAAWAMLWYRRRETRRLELDTRV